MASVTSSAQRLLYDVRQSSVVDGTLSRASVFRVGFGVGGSVIDPGLHGCVVWVRWASPWYLGWYVGPGRCGVSVVCFSFKNAVRVT